MIAVFISAIAYHLLGALWYSPFVFGKTWQSLVGITEEQIKSMTKAKMIRAYGGTFVCGLMVSAAVRALIAIIQPVSIPEVGIVACLVSFGFVAMTHLPAFLYQEKSMRLYLIDTGYHFFAIQISFAILGAEWFQILAS
jgi:hypothetical protein